MLVSLMASLNNNPGLAVGNAIGSNITNVALILGITAVLVPLSVHSGTVHRELPILLGTTVIAWLLLRDGRLDFIDGLLLLGGLAVMLTWVIWLGLHSREKDPMQEEYAAEIPTNMTLGYSLFWLVPGHAGDGRPDDRATGHGLGLPWRRTHQSLRRRPAAGLLYRLPDPAILHRRSLIDGHATIKLKIP